MFEEKKSPSKFEVRANVYDTSNVPSLFVELDAIKLGPIDYNEITTFNPLDPDCYHWVEKARWIKYEENYNELALRFNPAHVSPLNFKTLVEFRTNLDQHLKILDSEHGRLDLAMGQLTDYIYRNEALLTEPERDILLGIFLAPRLRSGGRHQFKYNKDFSKVNNLSSPRRISTLGTYLQQDEFNSEITKTLSDDCECCVILSGVLDILTRPVMKLLRLKRTITESLLVEVDKPVRFIFVCMGPSDRGVDYNEFARCFAVMMKNRRFRAAAYEANSGEKLLLASNTFLESSVVLPIVHNVTANVLGGMTEQMRKYDKSISKAVPRHSVNQMHIMPKIEEVVTIKPSILKAAELLPPEHEKKKVDYFGKFKQDFWPPLIQVIRAVKPYKERYISDFTDSFTRDYAPIVFSSVFFLYFVCLGPAITFGAILRQPLAIIGLTAPTFIIETSIINSAGKLGVEVPTLRFWVAIYGTMFGVFFLVFNLSALTKHIRESLEEIFNGFIDCYYALKALFTMFKAIKVFRPTEISEHPYSYNGTIPLEEYKLSQKFAIAGTNLFLAIVMLFFCLILTSFKNGNFFRRKIRKILGAFNVPLGILLVVGLERIFFQAFHIPKLPIPSSDQVDPNQWYRIVDISRLHDYGKSTSFEVHSIAVPIGLALAVLVFTESALNGITALKNKAKKTGIFEADFLLLIVIFPLVSGFVGWPFVSGATVRTISHITALTIMEERPPPGISAKIIGTVEQRMSSTIVGILLTCSVFIGTVLQHIPIAALYGMFLYMGIMGLRGLILIKRLVALFKRRKHWHDWEYIRGLPSKHILVFSVIEFTFVMILVILNIISEFTPAKPASLVFPLVIAIYGILREFIFPLWPWMAGYLHMLDEKHKVSVHGHDNENEGHGNSGNNNNQRSTNAEGYYKKTSSIEEFGTLSALPADPITDFANITMNEDTWKVRKSTVDERKMSIMNNFENYRSLLASYSGKELNEYSDEEPEYPSTWAT